MAAQNKMSISRAFLYNMLLITIFSILIIGFLWISSVSSRCKKDCDAWRTEHIASNKALVKNEVEKALNFIEYKKSAVLSVCQLTFQIVCRLIDYTTYTS